MESALSIGVATGLVFTTSLLMLDSVPVTFSSLLSRQGMLLTLVPALSMAAVEYNEDNGWIKSYDASSPVSAKNTAFAVGAMAALGYASTVDTNGRAYAVVGALALTVAIAVAAVEPYLTDL